MVTKGENITSNKELSRRKQHYVYRINKRLFDIILSIIGIILFFIPGLIISFLIKKESPRGSVFYTQIRIGKNNKPFKMYKFRSMYENADQQLEQLLDKNEVAGPMFKMKNDPRVTPIGNKIRAHSLDEIPQLWNVLKGEMSLVGPRPPLPREVKEYTDYDKLRLLVKPGCTGLWQVSARSNVGFDKMLELDLKYIRNRSFFYDFKIILKTIKIMIYPNSAY
nr:sugar transferase [Bombilactobacillus bombi]